VLARVDPATRKNNSRWGAYARQQARSSLHYGTGTSAAGQPPTVHRTMLRAKTSKAGVRRLQAVSPYREFILFAWDESSRSVVVGPVRLPDKRGDAPAALEHGGMSVIVSDGHEVTVSIAARPTMGPAGERANRELANIWKDSIR
jgi:hypothetical protein